MTLRLNTLLLCLVSIWSTPLLASEAVAVPELGHNQPTQIVGLDNGQFMLDYGRTVQLWHPSNGIVRTYTFEDSGDFRALHVTNVVSTKGDLAAMMVSATPKSNDQGRTWRTRITQITCPMDTTKCVYKVLETRSCVNASSFKYSVLGGAMGTQGVARFGIVRTHKKKYEEDGETKTRRTKTRWLQHTNGERLDDAAFPAGLWLVNSKNQDIQFNVKPKRHQSIGATRQKLAVYQGGKTAKIGPTIYSWDAGLISDDELIVSYKNPDADGLAIANVRLDTGQVTPQLIGLPESGLAQRLLVEPDKKGWLCVYYFCRNVFYKGLKIVHQRGEQQRVVDLSWESNRNLGWNLDGAIAGNGSVLLTWNDDILNDRQVFRYWPSVDALLESGKAAPTGWVLEPSSSYFVAGAGAIYDFHHLTSVADSGIPASSVIDANYQLAGTLSSQFLLEGEVGGVKLGATYLHSLVGGALEDSIGTDAKRAFQVVTAFAGWDKLFLDYDVQLKLEWGHLSGGMTVPGQPSLSRSIDTNYLQAEVNLLNEYRLKFGLEVSRLNAPMPVYAWGILSGDSYYQFLTGGIRQVEMLDFSLTLGYSLLDYVSKYEVNVFRPYLDGKFKVGALLGIADQRLDIPAPFDDEMAWELGLILGGEVEAGLLLQARSYALHGLGFFVKSGVRFRGHLRMAGLQPDDPADEEDGPKTASGDDSHYQMHVVHLSVGPFIQFGIVF